MSEDNGVKYLSMSIDALGYLCWIKETHSAHELYIDEFDRLSVLLYHNDTPRGYVVVEYERAHDDADFFVYAIEPERCKLIAWPAEFDRESICREGLRVGTLELLAHYVLRGNCFVLGDGKTDKVVCTVGDRECTIVGLSRYGTVHYVYNLPGHTLFVR